MTRPPGKDAGEMVSESLRLRTETSDHSADRTSINFKR